MIFTNGRFFNKMPFRNILLSLLLIGSGFFIGFSLWASVSSTVDGYKVSNTLHAYEQADPPHAYFTLDWFMRPDQHSILHGLLTTVTDDCWEENKQCKPQKWQMSDACEELTVAAIDGWDTHKVGSQFYDNNEDDAPDSTAGTVTFPKTHMKTAVQSNCKNARVPESIKLVQNERESWGIMGTHSTVVLSQFIFCIYFVLGVVSFLKEKSENSYLKDNSNKVNLLLTVTFILIFITVIVRSSQDTIVKINETSYARVNANSSYAYGLFHLILWLWYCVYNLKGAYKVMEIDEMGDTVKVASSGPAQMTGPPTAMYSYPQDSVPPTMTYKVLENAGLNMEGFAGSENVVATVVDPDAGYSTIKQEHFTTHKCCTVSTWSVLQVLVVPLWLLIIATSAHAYVLDTKLQLIFLSGLAFGIVDFYSDSMLDIFFAFEDLYVNMAVAADSDKFRLGFSKHLVNKKGGVNTSIVISQVMSVLIQLFIVILINYQVGLGYDTLHEDEVHVRSQIDMTGVFVFNIYFGILVALKLVKTFKGLESSLKTGVAGDVFKNGIDDIITFSNVTIVFVYLIINFVWIYRSENEILKPDYTADAAGKFNLNAERAIWLSKFVEWS